MRILLLVPVVLSFLAVSSAQLQNYKWTSITGNLTGIAVSPSGNIALCGSRGIVLLSSDKGTTWQQPYTGSGTDLQGIFYQDDKVCIAIGEYGTILRSTDGGKKWQYDDNIPPFYEGVYAPDRRGNTIMGITADKKICRSTDFGHTWEISKLSSAKVVAVNNGWVCGGNGAIFYSADDGLTWNSGTLDVASNDYNLSCVRQDANSNLYALLSSLTNKGSRLYRSIDGMQWTLAAELEEGTAFEFVKDALERIAVVNMENSTSPSFYSPKLYDITTKSYLPATTNVTNFAANLGNVRTITEGTMLAIGPRNTILRSTTQGSRWEALSYYPTDWLFNVSFSTDSVAYSSDFQTVCKTTDAGTTWHAYDTAILAGKDYKNIKAMTVMESAGIFGLYQDSLETGILFMRDSGLTFTYTPVSLPKNIKGYFDLYTRKNLLFVAYRNFGNLSEDSSFLFLSSDYGSNWKRIYAYPQTTLRRLLDISAAAQIIITEGIDNSTGIKQYMITSDSGNTWRQFLLPTLPSGKEGALLDINVKVLVFLEWIIPISK